MSELTPERLENICARAKRVGNSINCRKRDTKGQISGGCACEHIKIPPTDGEEYIFSGCTHQENY